MQDSSRHTFDFDLAEFEHWAHLATENPDAFEARRSRVIEDFINSVPEERRPRLRGLQWRIDQIRRTSRTPLAACIRINRMMWDSVLGAGGLHEVLNRALQGGAPEPVRAQPQPGAQILPFRGHTKNH